MGLTGTMVSQVEIKSDCDLFHDLFKYKQHNISTMSPVNVQSVDLHEGDWGSVGSVVVWSYVHDGKEKVTKAIVEVIDEEKKSLRFKVIEGDLTEQFKTFKFIVHVDTKGENNLVTWNLEYEKLSEDVLDPKTLMDFCVAVTKDIETHHLK